MEDIYIYADEGIRKGSFYSNFYGGCIVTGFTNHREIIKMLLEKAKSENITDEIKWDKVSEYNYPKYIELLDCFFSQLQQGKVKVRIMFTHNRYVAKGLDQRQKRDQYLLLYYQFLKNAFGLQYFEPDGQTKVSFYLDDIPQHQDKIDRFKMFLEYLNTHKNPTGKLFFASDDIREVSSKEHILIQIVDLIMGAVHSRLNNKFQGNGDGRRRPKRTIFRERLYKHIYQHINSLLPNFNLGDSTGWRGSERNLFDHPYRHWSFKQADPCFNPHYVSKN
ncbi:TPA: DUF3800 domain-containing protein [Legionella pneumophila]|uniref:DUF3800 domain-containing protein n=1 Tax=Legionella pneumophila TaxID=446 RepID=UPI000863451E|nr:DUF3800 domain-containing protein [Legionella pneumophila]AOU26009.1 hypothetical protein A9E77_11050 [Legionella pneumophila]HAT1781225.1 DUF3800 domain-containing protein [Legionella pneumophila]HAT7871338.1 DUF3800 domain-containing protein [Legionella pneumophila]HAT7880705.1 DUF3800 domain-containing protein [Legionella pneumophila]HAT7883597.1 DUF3800 domain-containing protein [Legionella pneumophila]